MKENKKGPDTSKWEGLDEILDELRGEEKPDWYPKSVTRRGKVSIEGAAESEHALKDFFDDQVEEENKGIAGTQVKGERPCVRQKHSQNS